MIPLVGNVNPLKTSKFEKVIIDNFKSAIAPLKLSAGGLQCIIIADHLHYLSN
jgi:hypothetical protein